MLKRIHIKGYKSLVDLEVELTPLAVLFGPNAVGKSNFLDALQLLSKLVTSRTLKEAFDPPYRGKPLESFTIGEKGIKGLVERERLTFSIEADLHLSDTVVETVNEEIGVMRHPGGEDKSQKTGKSSPQVRERNLRYRVKIEMLPKSGILRVADEYLAALNTRGEPTKKRKPFIERQNNKIHLRFEGQAHPIYHDQYLDHTILSMPLYPPHYPHLVAARREMESWLFFYFEPRERMRAANPVKEVRHIGLMGEELPAFLNTLRADAPKQFETVEKALRILIPSVDGIEVEINEFGEVELRLQENGVAIPARVLSEGTLRMLGLLTLTSIKNAPTLIGIEEPENGVHPRRIELLAELLKTQEMVERTQYIVTTHSPLLPDKMSDESLFVVRRSDGKTSIGQLSTWGPLGRLVRKDDIERAFEDDIEETLVSERILRGDFDA